MKRKLLSLCCCVLLLNVCGCTDISRYIDTMAAGSTEQLVTVEGTEKDTQLAQKETETEEEEVSSETESTQEEVKEITISFAGDCTLGGYQGQGAGGQFVDYYNEYGAGFFMESVKPIFESDDLTIVNLEGALTSQPLVVDKEFPIKGEPEYVEVLTEGSIEVCNVTNNHIMDCGTSGFQETVNLLSENDIGFFGEGYCYETEVDGVTIACLGYSVWGDSQWLRDTIQTDIQRERENGADIICIMFHYGTEKENYSNSTQETISRFAIDSGADIVVGSHPHVIQGIEEYNGKVICYSLGNFSFGANRNPSDKDTFIFQQTFEIDEEGDVAYGESTILPCSVSSRPDCNTYQPTPLEGEEGERVLARLKAYSSVYEESIFE